jgi:hypothetical protein
MGGSKLFIILSISGLEGVFLKPSHPFITATWIPPAGEETHKFPCNTPLSHGNVAGVSTENARVRNRLADFLPLKLSRLFQRII